MRLASLGMVAALVIAVAPTGCATVIGLDNGHPVSDDGGDPDGDAATTPDSAAPTCAPNNTHCTNDGDCCSGKCDNDRCSKPGG